MATAPSTVIIAKAVKARGRRRTGGPSARSIVAGDAICAPSLLAPRGGAVPETARMGAYTLVSPGRGGRGQRARRCPPGPGARAYPGGRLEMEAVVGRRPRPDPDELPLPRVAAMGRTRSHPARARGGGGGRLPATLSGAGILPPLLKFRQGHARLPQQSPA